ncbi:MAG: glycoside hydrolase family 97 N-terminal domain-containing protein [Pyrinomonadaceae bacterium]
MRVASPNGRLGVDFRLDADGAPRYAIRLDGKPVLRESRLGLVRDDADFSRGLLLLSTSRAVPERDRRARRRGAGRCSATSRQHTRCKSVSLTTPPR